MEARQERREALGIDESVGIYLEFEIVPKFEEVLKSLESARSGIELMNVRTEKSGKIFATVYVPNEAIGHFLKRAEEYLTQETKTHKPKNQTLIESLNDVRVAILDSFWTDKKQLFPAPGQTIWWEVWLRTTNDEEIGRFETVAAQTGLRIGTSRPLKFPDRSILLAFGTREQMSTSIELIGSIAELRLAKETPTAFIRLHPIDQGEWTKDLEQRLRFPHASAPAVCILDTGVNSGHRLLTGSLAVRDQHAWNPVWTKDDRKGHGTAMAGIALFGSLTEPLLAQGPVQLDHRLESVKILPDSGQNSPSLYGDITQEAVRLAERAAPDRPRSFCLAVTAKDHQETGRPSEWSAEIDALAMGYNQGLKRLFLVSTGNIWDLLPTGYTDLNEVRAVEDPGQSWNAVVVGAYTDLTNLADAGYDGYRLVAPPGDLCPRSLTSLVWEKTWPLKPDIVLEGGNAVTDGKIVDTPDSLSLLTTHYQPQFKPFATTGDTSAATAQAARMAAIIQAHNPKFWPETVRALLVHSAEWTPAMKRRAAARNNTPQRRTDYLLRTFGHGVPDLDRALRSAQNDLTLIMQNELQPFVKGGSKEMDLFPLPWPKAVLQDLGEAEVELRVTLSYFIEPKPGTRGDRFRHLYASHGLRFDIKLPTESKTEFEKRLNKSALEEEEKKPSAGPTASKGWDLGSVLRSKGSIHSDTWRGTAADLAEREYIGVYPVIGWWRTSALARWNERVRYALVVSIRTAATNVDIYTPVFNQIQTETEIGW